MTIVIHELYSDEAKRSGLHHADMKMSCLPTNIIRKFYSKKFMSALEKNMGKRI